MTPADTDQQDLTRKERREQARSERRVAEEAHAANAARRSRLVQLGAVAAVVVVAIVVIVVATGGGSSSHISKAGSKVASKNVAEIQSLIGGIPQNGNVLGASTAPVTLQYFGDLECPICREFTEGALPTIIKKWVRTGKLRIEYRSLETATREPETFHLQQVAALAAGKQNLMWYFIELFYKEQGEEGSEYVNEAYLHKLASAVPGLNLAQWSAARQNAQLGQQVEEDGQTANQHGFNGTPSFLIGHSGGAMEKLESSSFTDPSSFNAAIEKLV